MSPGERIVQKTGTNEELPGCRCNGRSCPIHIVVKSQLQKPSVDSKDNHRQITVLITTAMEPCIITMNLSET